MFKLIGYIFLKNNEKNGNELYLFNGKTYYLDNVYRSLHPFEINMDIVNEAINSNKKLNYNYCNSTYEYI